MTMGKNLAAQAMERLVKDWSKTCLTKEKLHANVKEFARFCERTYGLQKVDNIKPHMVEAYVRSMHDRGFAPSTMADRMTAVRLMAQAVGKANIVARENADYGISRAGTRCTPIQTNSERLAEIQAAITTRAETGDRVALMMRAANVLRQ